MKLPEIDVESVHLGCLLSRQAVLDLIPPMAVHYARRLRPHTLADADDLSQAALLALLEQEAETGQQDALRELPALTLLHTAMWAEAANQRRQSADFPEPAERKQLSEKQVEMIWYWLRMLWNYLRHPEFEMLWLSKVLEWSNEDICEYFRRLKNTHHHRYYSPDAIGKIITKAERRLRKKMPDDVNTELRLLQCLK